MSSETLEAVRKRLDESLRQPIPRKPKAPPAPPEPAEVVSLIPQAKPRIIKRGWQAHPPTQTSYKVYQPSKSDEDEELRRQNAVAARKARLLRDEYGLFWDAPESAEELERIQNDRWRR